MVLIHVHIVTASSITSIKKHFRCSVRGALYIYSTVAVYKNFWLISPDTDRVDLAPFSVWGGSGCQGFI